MVFLRNYSFDFFHEGHDQQPYIYRKGSVSTFNHQVFCIKIRKIPEIEFFYCIDFVDIQSRVFL